MFLPAVPVSMCLLEKPVNVIHLHLFEKHGIITIQIEP